MQTLALHHNLVWRAAGLPPWAERSRFNHFYRLAVNTRAPQAASAANGKRWPFVTSRLLPKILQPEISRRIQGSIFRFPFVMARCSA